jgi:hypothetical protein
MVYGALVAILQSTIGPEVGGTLLDKLAREFEKRFNSIQENATAINKNILLMFVYLFNFKVWFVRWCYSAEANASCRSSMLVSCTTLPTNWLLDSTKTT